jgi:hypothetical protein
MRTPGDKAGENPDNRGGHDLLNAISKWKVINRKGRKVTRRSAKNCGNGFFQCCHSGCELEINGMNDE